MFVFTCDAGRDGLKIIGFVSRAGHRQFSAEEVVKQARDDVDARYRAPKNQHESAEQIDYLARKVHKMLYFVVSGYNIFRLSKKFEMKQSRKPSGRVSMSRQAMSEPFCFYCYL